MAAQAATLLGMDFINEQLTGLLPRETTAVLRRTFTKIAAKVRKGMRAGAPRQEGILRRAIVSKRRRGTRDRIEAGVFITKGRDAKYDAFYWHMVVFGTQHSAAQDFITPVVEDARSTFRKDVGGEVGRQVTKQLVKRAKRQGLKR
jgi:HK97 gp10 family phage protein